MAREIKVVVTWADLARHVETGQTSYFGSGVNPEGPKPEAQRADSGWDSLGWGSQPPLHQLEGLWSDVSSSSGVRGGARPLKGFVVF